MNLGCLLALVLGIVGFLVLGPLGLLIGVIVGMGCGMISALKQGKATETPQAILRAEILKATDPVQEAALKEKLRALQQAEGKTRLRNMLGALAVLAVVVFLSLVTRQPTKNTNPSGVPSRTPMPLHPSETQEQREARQQAERDAQWLEFEARQKAEATSTPSSSPTVRRASPNR
jgi:hypothetical protein